MEGSVSKKLEVNVSASEIWKAYGSLQLAQIAVDAFPRHIVDTQSWKAMATLEPSSKSLWLQVCRGGMVQAKVLGGDDVRRVKLAPTIEGGVLEQGFKSYITRLEAIEKKGKRDECIMIGTVEYVLEDESAFPLVASSIDGLYDIMKAVADYVIKQHNTTN
ncbi:UNVERIFIED_CONTAM: hypothetical protein Scaly_3098400 [Sesamum calycinum]|uniref:Bet v I/Major latex protein domain-containing protein n=1 Tax=Sesamum calycinum TaxID=2727403 RepID=A0AAW2JN03_9LAMI